MQTISMIHSINSHERGVNFAIADEIHGSEKLAGSSAADQAGQGNNISPNAVGSLVVGTVLRYIEILLIAVRFGLVTLLET